MSEEFSYGAQGAVAGQQIATALSASGPGGMLLGAAIGIFTGYKAKKARKKAQRAADAATASQMMSSARETGRVSRFEAATQRSLYSASGVSTSSGSAAEMERGMLAEAIYQQEAVLAGLPKKHHGYKNIAGRIEVRNQYHKRTLRHRSSTRAMGIPTSRERFGLGGALGGLPLTQQVAALGVLSGSTGSNTPLPGGRSWL